MKLVTLVFCIIEGTMNFFLLSAAVLALASQAVSQHCSTGPRIYYHLIEGTDCKDYVRDLNGIFTYHVCPADLRFNIDQAICGCDSSNFVCPF